LAKAVGIFPEIATASRARELRDSRHDPAQSYRTAGALKTGICRPKAKVKRFTCELCSGATSCLKTRFSWWTNAVGTILQRTTFRIGRSYRRVVRRSPTRTPPSFPIRNDFRPILVYPLHKIPPTHHSRFLSKHYVLVDIFSIRLIFVLIGSPHPESPRSVSPRKRDTVPIVQRASKLHVFGIGLNHDLEVQQDI